MIDNITPQHQVELTKCFRAFTTFFYSTYNLINSLNWRVPDQLLLSYSQNLIVLTWLFPCPLLLLLYFLLQDGVATIVGPPFLGTSCDRGDWRRRNGRRQREWLAGCCLSYLEVCWYCSLSPALAKVCRLFIALLHAAGVEDQYKCLDRCKWKCYSRPLEPLQLISTGQQTACTLTIMFNQCCIIWIEFDLVCVFPLQASKDPWPFLSRPKRQSV